MNIILLLSAILFSIFLDIVVIESAVTVLYGYYDIEPDHHDLGAWLLWGIEGFLGSLLCFFIARKMGLKALRFAFTGFIWWSLTFCFLAIYPYLTGENKYRHYNNYVLVLGGLRYILWFVVFFEAISDKN